MTKLDEKLSNKERNFIDNFLKSQTDFNFDDERNNFYDFLLNIGVKNDNILDRRVINRWSIKTYYAKYKKKDLLKFVQSELNLTQRALADLLKFILLQFKNGKQIMKYQNKLK